MKINLKIKMNELRKIRNYEKNNDFRLHTNNNNLKDKKLVKKKIKWLCESIFFFLFNLIYINKKKLFCNNN